MHGFWPKKIWYKFNIYPAHSCGFFVKKKIHKGKRLGLYDTKFKYSSDRDFIYRLIKSNYKGMSSKKSDIFGRFNPNGISSKIGFLQKLLEELKIRHKNQSLITVFFVLLITLANKLYNLIIKK